MLKYPHTIGRTSFALIREVEMERVETQESENGSQSVDAFITIMGLDYPGRVRLYARGVTKSLLKHKSSYSRPSSNIIADKSVEKRMDDQEERIQKRMQARRDAIEQDITMNIIVQLQHQNPGSTLDPNVLRFNARSLKEEASIQQINRPFIGSNNEGRLLNVILSMKCLVKCGCGVLKFLLWLNS
ncbi:hypothetical protein FXO38_14198 [Capsicum annuum]|nr:hypothetical protein FXO38_14198 [Capsicum annuum]